MFLFFSIRLPAQVIVTGTVIDGGSHKPIEFATIELQHLPDSAITKLTATDKKGKYLLESIPVGDYILKCTFIGYEKIFSPAFTLTEATPKFSLEPLQLVAGSKTLTEVTVTGRKSQFNAAIDRKIYNVEQDIMSRSGSVSDVLKNIPSVEVDVEGNVSLRGSGDVMILINGKPNPMMGRTAAEVLQQLPANSVERIEVITNPSARYRPGGTSGIINIVLKKNIKNGFNGSLTGNAGNKERFNGNLSLNVKPGNYNLYATLSARKDTRTRYNELDKTYLDQTVYPLSGHYTQNTVSRALPQARMVNGGIDITLDEKNSLGASLSYFNWRQTRNDITHGTTYNWQQVLTNDFDRLRYDPELEKEFSAGFNYLHLFKKEDHELNIEFNIADESESEKNYYTTDYRLSAVSKFRENLFIKNLTAEKQLTIDYTYPISEDSKLEAGYDGLFDNNDMDYAAELYDGAAGHFIKDSTRSNRFIFDENVHGLYLTYQKSFEKFGFELGLRGEAVVNRGHLVTIDSFIRNNYFKLYPTLHLSYQLSEQHELQLNYSRRINRPDGNELNPFPEYQDPRNIRAGNPTLLPEIIHSIEMGYKWQHKDFSFVPSIYYRRKTRGFTSVVVPLNDTTLLSTTQNLSQDESAGLELIFSYKKGKFYSGTFSANLFYNTIDATNLGYINNKSIYSGTLNFNNNFNLSSTTILQLNSNFRSARLTPQGKTYPSIVVNGGLRQELIKGKLFTTFTASDIFGSNKRREELDLPNIKQTSLSKRDGIVIYLGISWRFGVIIKKKEEKLEFDTGL